MLEDHSWRVTGLQCHLCCILYLRQTVTAEGMTQRVMLPRDGRIVRLARGKPCIAVGGVRPEDVGAVRAVGGVGVAVVSGILGEEDVEAAARRYALSP